MGPYVRWKRGIDFRAIRTLSLGEWRRLLRRSAFGGGSIRAPGLGAGDLGQFGPIKRRVARMYNVAVGMAIGQAVARAGGRVSR